MESLKTQLIRTKTFVAVLIIFCFSSNSFSQINTETINGGETITIHSKILNEDRIILISLPENYKNNNKNFPVLYVLDGKTHFRQATGAADFMRRQELAPEMIVAAVTNVDRNRDFSPIHADNFPTSGGAEKFHDFLKKELIPYIEKNYRASDYKILTGHSLGGTFAAYSLLENPDVFDAYIAVSPFLQYADNYIIDQAKIKLKIRYKNIKSFYMTIGDEPEYFKALDEFSELIQIKSDSAIKFQYIHMKGENHRTTPYVSLFNGLRFIYSDWVLSNETFLKGLTAIDEHYKKISDKYNYEIKTPENTINVLGYNYLRADEIEKAINIFKDNIKRFPNSANVYDSLGEAYEKNKEFKLAKENYQKAYKLGIEQNHVFKSVFKINLERVENLADK